MNTPPSYNPTSHRQRQSTSTKKKKRLTSTKIFPHLSGNFGSLLLKMFQEDLKVIHAVRFHTRSDLETHSSLQGGHLPGFPMKLGRHGMDRHERGGKKVCKKLGKKSGTWTLQKTMPRWNRWNVFFFRFVDIGRQHVLGTLNVETTPTSSNMNTAFKHLAVDTAEN